jgi:hypothetical protein
MAEPQKDLSGVLFRNDRRRDGKQDPNLQGSCTIDGRRYWISAWTNTVQRGERRGEKYIALSVPVRRGATRARARSRTR